MDEQANLPYQDSSQTSWRFAGQGQRNDGGTVISRLSRETGQSDSQSPALDEPYWPTANEAVDLNKQAIGDYHHIFGDSPEWGGVLKPNELESAIGSAQNHYHYDPEPDDAARYAQAIAKMGWRIAGNQTFANGNKRVAYGLMQHALDQNGLGHLSPIDQPDPELVDHLIAQDSYSGDPNDRQRLENEYLNMWRQRYMQGGPTPRYQQRYPEGTYITNPQEAQTQNLQGLARRSNILDPIQATLDPTVFDNPGASEPLLKAHHSHWIKSHIYKTLDAAGYDSVEQWLTLCLTGSLTTFQYSPDSDCDVSLFVDSVKFPEWSRAEMIALLIDKMDGIILPGTTHPMQDFVVGEGIKPTDLYKPGLRSAYDIDTNKWIVPPEHREQDVKSTEGGFYAFALQQADKMQTLLRYEPDKAVQFYEQIHHKRARDMKAGKGDFSESNLIYKMLAQRGLFKDIAEYSGKYLAKTEMPTKPPHLKEAKSDKKYCGNCWAFDKGHCDMFGGYKVREDQVCSDWESKKKHESKSVV